MRLLKPLQLKRNMLSLRNKSAIKLSHLFLFICLGMSLSSCDLPAVLSICKALNLSYCKSPEDKLQEQLVRMHKINPQVNLSGWEIGSVGEDEDEIWFNIYRNKKDTVKNLSFLNHKEEAIFNINGFGVAFSDSLYNYELLYNDLYDTAYYYKTPKEKLDSKIFIVGKYYYQYVHSELNRKQKKYALQHWDSVLNVEGNDLPPLPEAN